MARPLLLVHWRDHYSTDGWIGLDPEEDIAPLLERAVVTSVGWLLAENDERLVLFQTLGIEGKRVRDTITIEKACIVKRRALR